MNGVNYSNVTNVSTLKSHKDYYQAIIDKSNNVLIDIDKQLKKLGDEPFNRLEEAINAEIAASRDGHHNLVAEIYEGLRLAFEGNHFKTSSGNTVQEAMNRLTHHFIDANKGINHG